MSSTGDWGDKLIVTLHSDGIRRHQNWCRHYEAAGKRCTLLCEKCRGSAFCQYYKTGIKEEAPTTPSLPPKKARAGVATKQPASPKPVTPPPPSPKVEELFRRAGHGDKLLGKTVLIRKDIFSFKIAEVIEEDFHLFYTLEQGQKRTYVKRTAYEKKAIYILEESK